MVSPVFADSLLVGGGWLSLLAELCLILSCGFAAVLTTTQFIAVEIEANQHFRRSLLNLQNFLVCIFYVVVMPQ